jgi:hypothetical protein
MNNLLNEHQTAELLRVSVRNLQRLRTNCSGPRWVKIGRLVRYQLAAVEDFIRACNRESSPDGTLIKHSPASRADRSAGANLAEGQLPCVP